MKRDILKNPSCRYPGRNKWECENVRTSESNGLIISLIKSVNSERVGQYNDKVNFISAIYVRHVNSWDTVWISWSSTQSSRVWVCRVFFSDPPSLKSVISAAQMKISSTSKTFDMSGPSLASIANTCYKSQPSDVYGYGLNIYSTAICPIGLLQPVHNNILCIPNS